MKRLPRLLVPIIVLLSAVVVRATIGVGLQDQLGNPSSATTDPGNHVRYYIGDRAQYAMDYNDTTRQPNWVSWDLTAGDVGSSGRSDFAVDTTLPAGFYHVLTTDYSGSGYDRGHMCPSADRTVSTADNQIVFYMSNMVPQAPDNNQGVWANFESYCRSLASAGNEILITSGPSIFAGSTIASGVAIPGYTWKIAVVVPIGPGTAVSRITGSTRVIAIKVPNIAGVRSTPWQNFVTSVAQIEADTGYTFFTNLSAPIASALRTVVDGQSPAGAPAIVAQPNSQTTVVGGSATFFVTASGDAPLAYQWFHDDNEIAGATNASLALANVQAADVGNYVVVVSNSLGSATSNAAALVVNGLPPVISSSPAPETVPAGSSVTFSVTATGSPTLTYQWRKGGITIVGNPSATTSALTLTNVQAGDSASYDVVVTNSVSFATSAAASLTVTPAAPTLLTQPASKTVSTGSNTSLTVAASGTAPLSYQWRKAGSPLTDGGSISGATTATLLFTSVTAVNAGDYDVVVTNALGSVTSSTATLTVNPPPPSTAYWDFATASPTSGLTTDISGGVVTQGNNNGTTTLITSTSASSGYTGASGGNNAGAAARIGALNQAANGSAYFEFTLTAVAGKRLLASGISFGMRSTSTGPQAFGVYTSLDAYAAPIATGAVPANGNWSLYTPAFTTVTGPTGGSITFRIYGYNGTGSPGAGTANWRIDDLKLSVTTVFPPPVPPVVIATTPANGATAVAIASPITVTFNEAVGFTGAWFAMSSAAHGPLAAAVTGGPTTFTLTPPSFFANSDAITVTILGAQVVDQATGTIHGTSNTTFSFTTEAYVPPTPPTVTTQPLAQSVNVGGTATFTVGATGTAPLGYQWRKNGTALLGNPSATTATLTLSGVVTGDAGSYDCLVSNVAGSDLSHTATLTVTIVPPTIATQPVAQSAAVGGSASFTVAASGTAPFSYVWRKNGTPISGATAATLALTNLTYVDSGAYDVVVSNSAGSATSAAATLAVLDAAPSAIYWDFASAAPTSGVPAGVTGGTVSQGNNNGTTTLLTTTSASSGYTGASGGNNAGAAARIGALNPGASGSAYFEFGFAAPAGRKLAVTAISFGMRSTSTGPQAFALFSSADNFAAPLATGTVPNNGAWNLYTPAIGGVTTTAGGTITFRLFGYNGTGSASANTANWRIDDLKLTAGLLALPPVPPTITTSPLAQTATVGDTVSFTVAATGTAPLSYQWRKGGNPITGNTSAATVTLTLASVTTADAGSYDCLVTNVAGSATSAAAVLTVNKAVATVTFGALAFTYDTTPHAATATTTPAGLNVVFSYNGGVTVPVNAGFYAVIATIDDANYTGSATGTLTITPAAATVVLTNLAQTYNGLPHSAGATTTPAGIPVTFTYNGSAPAPINAGAYAVVGTISDPNYTGSASGTLVISKAPATILLADLIQSYDGAPKPVTVTTTPTGLDVSVTYDGSATPPTNPGSYVVVATINDANYAGSTTGTLVIGITALVRHAPELSGGLDGSVQVLSGENVALAGNTWIAGDLLVPGTPTVVLNGQPTLAGAVDGAGSVTPSGYQVTLSGNALVRYVVRRTNAIPMPTVSAPPAPTGTRNVTINSAGQSGGDFATVRNLTLNGNAGNFAVPAGAYGSITVNGNNHLVLGTVGATTPSVYNLQSLALNGSSQLTILGPVVINVASAVSLSGNAGAPAHVDWLKLNVASGGVTLNGGITFNGSITAPAGSVIISGNSTLRGTVSADRLTIHSNGLLSEP